MTNNDYDINEHGTIITPGKFESEPAYAPYFYDFVLDGSSSETIYDGETPVDVFIVDDEDRAKFPALLDGVYAVALWTSETGFVNTNEYTEEELNTLREQCEASEENGEEA